MKSFASVFATLALALAACGGDESTHKSAEKIDRPARKVEAPEAPPVVVEAPKPAPVAPAPAPAPVDETRTDEPDKPEVDESIEALAKEVATHPRDADKRVALARQLLEAGDLDAAKKHAERATELKPDWSTAWNTLGRVELAAGALDDAIASFQTAVEANEENAYAWNNLGYALIRARRWGDAVEALERAVDSDTVEAFMWNNLGMAYEHMNRLDDARDAYDQGAAAGSTLAAAHRERLEGVHSIAGLPEIDEEPGESGTH